MQDLKRGRKLTIGDKGSKEIVSSESCAVPSPILEAVLASNDSAAGTDGYGVDDFLVVIAEVLLGTVEDC